MKHCLYAFSSTFPWWRLICQDLSESLLLHWLWSSKTQQKMRRFLIILVCSSADVLTFHLEKRPYGRRLQILQAEEYPLGNLWHKPKAGCCLGLALLALSSFTMTVKNKNKTKPKNSKVTASPQTTAGDWGFLSPPLVSVWKQLKNCIQLNLLKY